MEHTSSQFRRIAAAAVAIVATMSLLTVNSATAAVGSPASSGIMRSWSASWSNGTPPVTKQEAVTAASQFSIIAAQLGTFKPYVSAMKAANPGLRLIAYVNGIWSDPTNPNTRNYPESWFSHDKRGHRITWIGWGTQLMDPSNVGWQGQVGKLCRQALIDSGYDGCYIDNLGNGSITYPRDKSGIPVNPRTGLAWTPADWMPNLAKLARAVRAACPTILIVTNGLGSGVDYFAADGPSSMLGGIFSGLVTEQFTRSGPTPVDTFKRPSAWQKDVDMVVADQAQGDSVFAVVKLKVAANAAQQRQWHKYALASFLLATNGSSYFQFIPNSDPASAITVSPWDKVNPGLPQGPYTQIGTIFERTFTLGKVLVNPTTTAADVSLGGMYTTLDGARVSSIRLPPDSGEVLLH